ncbi:MAG: flagellar hook protein FlgE [Sulfurovum sp. FS06-10]|nr:MAG: flagellar hook protein FlgE [Sulfurovum sp. FS06-10]
MMRSLWAGVTGLQAHQIAMDVEGNNIANVNTTGFKYSRANFADLLSQTSKIATAPQGELGGKNSMQIGLGTQISSVTKIFKQGSVQVTDKNTDLAIQGDGFFVVSPDGGKTYKYGRNGDFSFDAQGNFTDSNGYIIQGWIRDETTGKIDATAPIANITIPPGLTTPANDTSFITLKANLASGSSVGNNKSPIYTLDANHGWVDIDGDGIQNALETHVENDTGQNAFDANKELYERGQDVGALFNASGEAFNLTNGQGVWISYAEARTETTTLTFNAATTVVDLVLNGESISGSITSTDDNAIATYIASLVNQKTALTGVEAQVSSGNQIYFVNDNKTGTEEKTKNIKLTKGGTDNTDLTSNTAITAYQYTYTSSPLNTSHAYDDSIDRKFRTTEDLRNAMQTDARLYIDYNNVIATQGPDKNDGVAVIVNAQGQFEISNPSGDALNADDGDITNSTLVVPIQITADTLTTQDITFPAGTVIQAGTILSAPTVINGVTVAAGATAVAYNLTEAATIPTGSTLEASVGTPMIYPAGTNFRATDDYNLYLSVTSLSNASNNIGSNSKFMTSMAALQGTLTSGSGTRTTQGVYAASHASSIDVYDSLGSKHTVRFEFSKTGYTTDGGTEWSMIISVPEPGDINLGSYPENIITGSISFNSDGSLATYSPTNITYTANNGSTPNQNIELNFGTLSQFDGMTSYDSASNTSGISQDGYPGGDLAGIRVDETGTLIGSFTNGRSFGLAQVAMAKFTNNEGLESDGGNTFIQTSNSGDPIIGQAAVGGRGFIQASSLEMSNVDLSRSLTQLIVIQRGYQANSKTITTSDQMLNTLLQLKQ